LFPVFLDTCVLLKPYLCDTLLSIAECRIYRPLWSAGVLTELDRNLRKRGATPEQVAHRLDQMGRHFPDAEVVGYEHLVDSMQNHPKDRHVLAAAVRGGAAVLVTENLKDFPENVLRRYDVVAVHQDDFLQDQLNLRVRGGLSTRPQHVERTSGSPLVIAVGGPRGGPGRWRPGLPRGRGGRGRR
jgi:predicted nucleic acid-binding protein